MVALKPEFVVDRNARKKAVMLSLSDWKRVQKINAPYMFGHFELPRFKMNAMVEMPDHGQLNKDHFAAKRTVFSGHFHKRQNRGKIWYIGNAFPHNFADNWDDERGMNPRAGQIVPQRLGEARHRSLRGSVDRLARRCHLGGEGAHVDDRPPAGAQHVRDALSTVRQVRRL